MDFYVGVFDRQPAALDLDMENVALDKLFA